MPRIENALSKAIQSAIRKAQKKKELPKFEIPAIAIERPKSSEHGDFSTPVCLVMARYARMAPIEIAKRITARFPETDYLEAPEIAHPGYINFRLRLSWLQSQVRAIVAAGETYADVDLGHGRRVQVEYGSANPTGPLHMGFGRNVVLGDGIASVLSAAGYKVQREYYVNDAGTQMSLFAESLYARYAQALGQEFRVPQDGYQGDYLIQWGKEIAYEQGRRFLEMERDTALGELGKIGLEEKVLASVRKDCADLGIHYDHWFYEHKVYEQGEFQKIMTLLRQRDLLTEREGAVWFAASTFGSDLKDEVLIRSNGQPGYFASDIAYHYNKFVERGFDWVINIWGADHQGHVPRMKAMMEGLGLDPDRLTLVIYQLVTIRQGGEDVRLSKRAGTMVELRELIDEVGADAVRFTLLSRAADSQMEFDVDLAKEQSDRNPVYYVQYAHARIASILREAGEWEGIGADDNVHLLDHPAELDLIRKMVDLSPVIERAALQLAPHHLTYYAQELATLFNIFYRDCRVLARKTGEPGVTPEQTNARLQLVRAAKIILARTLHLMGMTAPESM
jgi:arginyl-tRNA synthetase